MLKHISNKWKIAFKTMPFVAVVVLAKFLIHQNGWEFLTLNSLFTAIISANIFLIGFLITGVLSDFKEAEKLPGDLAVSLETLVDEAEVTYKNKGAEVAQEMRAHLVNLSDSIMSWFYKKEKTFALFEKLKKLNDYFLALEPLTQANFIVRLKNEQSNIRRIITRIHTIRETSFNEAGYAIAEIISVILIAGFIFIKMDPFYESVFFISFVSFILIYMIGLIKDLDNPFEYYAEDQSSGEVSLKPLLDLQERLKK